MRVFKLKNGITVVHEKNKSKSVAIHVTVKVGSNNESAKIRGISHFIEHMLFEGTEKRTALQIARDIEGIGGEIGAFTGNNRTCYYVKSLSRHFDKMLEVLSDIILNPKFDEKLIEKERKVILSEVKTRYDEPRFFQWLFFQSTLFKKHPAKYPIIGNTETISKVSREEIVNYYSEQYVPEKIIVSVAGNVDKVKEKIEKRFSSIKQGRAKKLIIPKEPAMKKSVKKTKRKTQMSYMIIGYKTVPRLHKDTYVLDVIRAIMGKGLSGRLFDVIRNQRGLAYDLGCHHEAESNFGFFSVYITADKKNLGEVKKLILQELFSVDKVSNKELNEAKNFIEGEHIMDNEDNQQYADNLGFWQGCHGLDEMKDYVEKIRKVSRKEIARVRKKFLNNKYHMVVIEQS